MTLHIVSNAKALDECLELIQGKEAVVLRGEARFLEAKDIAKIQEHTGTAFYHLREEATQNTFEEELKRNTVIGDCLLAHTVRPINHSDLVELCITHTPIKSWH